MELRAFRGEVGEYVSSIRRRRRVPNTLPEHALYTDLQGLLDAVLRVDGPRGAVSVGQARTAQGIPDFVLDAGGVLGYVEAKKPSMDLGNLPPRDRAQQHRFLDLPNLLYTNYRDFVLYESGEQVGAASLGPLALFDHREARDPSRQDVEDLRTLLVRFVQHRVTAPRSAGELAEVLARATRVLRDAAATALRRPGSVLSGLREEWQRELFGEGTTGEFADAYAQTVAYGLLTARLATDGEFSVHRAADVLDDHHPFLGAALRLLTFLPAAEDEVGWAVRVVEEVVDGVSLETFRRSRHADDPLLYFYEEFLAAYDPALRDRRGVYYTPPSVVGFQVRAVAQELAALGRPRLLAAGDVVALDPAAGTGTYLLGLLDETRDRLREAGVEAGRSAHLRRAARQLHGFELLVGPYTVASQRVATWLRQEGVTDERPRVHLTDTLLPPGALRHEQQQLNVFVQDLAREREAADEVKRSGEVVVVIGNPPYDRGRARPREDWLQQQMRSFSDPVRQEERVNLRNLSDPYVYFMRWALWKLFEAPGLAPGPRVLSFITNRSYLSGGAFEGLRLRLREHFDRIDIIDLGGESRGANPEPNVFAIRAGVAIIVAVRRDVAEPSPRDAEVRYARLRGTREDKERGLKAALADLAWTGVERRGGEPFLPDVPRSWARWPALDALLPVRYSGVETKRDRLVVGTTRDEVVERVSAVIDESVPVDDRRDLFHETEARPLPEAQTADRPHVVPYGYRPHDVRWLYDDEDYIDRPRPRLRRAWQPGQRAFVTLPRLHGRGPAVVLLTELPDRHAFRGSFGGHVFPLWLDEAHTEPNLAPGVLDALSEHLDRPVAAGALLGAVFGLLNAPRFTLLHRDELAQGFPRVPLPLDGDLLVRAATLGSELLDLHAGDRGPGVPTRLRGDPGPLTAPRWGDGRLYVAGAHCWVEPVSYAAWAYEVSGYRVLQRWLEARAGRDLARDADLVDEVTHLCAVIEETVLALPALDGVLDEVLAGDTFGWRALLPLDPERARRQLRALAEDDAGAEAEQWRQLDLESVLLSDGP